MRNKIIWITGASSGTGEALVHEFSKLNNKIIISARRKEELERVKNDCKKYNSSIEILPLDLANHDSLEEISAKALQIFGGIDLIFHNGGITQRSLAKDTVFDVDKKLMDVNYFGAVKITKSILHYMIKQKSGHIAVMTSLTGKFGMPQRSAYAASKHALHGFFDSLRAELFDFNINITLICSGYINTNIAINAMNENGFAQKKQDPNIQKGMSPQEFAQKAIKAINKNKQEVVFGGKERFGVYLKRFFPTLFSKIIRTKN